MVRALELEVIEIAKFYKFQAIIGLNTSQVTMEMQREMGFKTLREHKLNELKTKDGRPMYPGYDDQHVVRLDYLMIS